MSAPAEFVFKRALETDETVRFVVEALVALIAVVEALVNVWRPVNTLAE